MQSAFSAWSGGKEVRLADQRQRVHFFIRNARISERTEVKLMMKQHEAPQVIFPMLLTFTYKVCP